MNNSVSVYSFEHYTIELTKVMQAKDCYKLFAAVKDSEGEVQLSGVEAIHDLDGWLEISPEYPSVWENCSTNTRSYWKDEGYDLGRIARDLSKGIDANCWLTAKVRGFKHYGFPLPQPSANEFDFSY